MSSVLDIIVHVSYLLTFELIRVSAARNTLIGVKSLTQNEIEQIRATCAAKARRAVNGTVKEANNVTGR